jgi:hypothetical protein
MALGKLKCDTIENEGGSSITVADLVTLNTNKANLSGATFTGDVTLNAQQELRLADSDSSNYIALKAPATVGSNVTLTFPANDGDADQVLTTNGSGVLSWAAASGGKVLGSAVFTDFTRTTISGSSSFVTLFTISYNKQSSTSKLYVWGQTQGFGQRSGGTIYSMRYASGTLVNGAGSFTYPGNSYGNAIIWAGVISSSSTGSNNIEIGYSGAGSNVGQNLLHPIQSDHGDFTNGQAGTHILIFEVEA